MLSHIASTAAEPKLGLEVEQLGEGAGAREAVDAVAQVEGDGDEGAGAGARGECYGVDDDVGERAAVVAVIFGGIERDADEARDEVRGGVPRVHEREDRAAVRDAHDVAVGGGRVRRVSWWPIRGEDRNGGRERGRR